MLATTEAGNLLLASSDERHINACPFIQHKGPARTHVMYGCNPRLDLVRFGVHNLVLGVSSGRPRPRANARISLERTAW